MKTTKTQPTQAQPAVGGVLSPLEYFLLLTLAEEDSEPCPDDHWNWCSPDAEPIFATLEHYKLLEGKWDTPPTRRLYRITESGRQAVLDITLAMPTSIH